MQELTVIQWKLSKIQGYRRRLRRNEEAVARMRQSIETYGFRIPVLVTPDGEVVDGDLRVKAARAMGWTEVPVVVCAGWTAEQVRGFRLLANESANWSTWDWEAVALELGELREMEFDLTLTGFGGATLGEVVLEPAAADVNVTGERAGACERCTTCGQKVR